MKRVDVAIAGGGLAGALIAWRLSAARPDLSIAVFEAGDVLGGQHTWSFHQTDLDNVARQWLAPLVVHQWPSQQVAFPGFERTLSTGYATITSRRLHRVLSAELGDKVRYGAPVETLSAGGVVLSGGEAVAAGAVIDARGAQASPHLRLGFQKFVGREITFEEPHGFKAPLIMDATVPQIDGYRFIYVLPFDDKTALVEDTRYADGAVLDRSAILEDLGEFLRLRGLQPARVIREEDGVLPIALAGDIDALWAEAPDGVSLAGLRAALFHPLTGYSLPDAAALATHIADARDYDGGALRARIEAFSRARWRRRAFYRLLTRMLFQAAAPAERYKVLARFYKMPQPLIERFYAGVSLWRDQARILSGRPPVPISRAVTCLSEASAMKVRKENPYV